MSIAFPLKPVTKALLVLSTLSGLLVAAPAQAAIDMFIKINGINGASVDSLYGGPNKASDLLAFSWGVSNSGGSSPSFNDFSWTQYLDSATPAMFIGVAGGKHFDTATFTARTAGATPQVFLTMKFDDVVLTSLSMAGSGGEDRLTTNQSLRPMSKITMTYTAPAVKGAPSKSITAVWDLKNGVVNGFSGNPEALFGLFLAGPQSLDVSGLPFVINQPVPEPQTWLMFGLGLAGLAGWRRRRQGSSAHAALPA
jgi:type VI secretion system secreted protein Hcp